MGENIARSICYPSKGEFMICDKNHALVYKTKYTDDQLCPALDVAPPTLAANTTKTFLARKR